MKVLHMASGDGWGGAERVISLLVEGTLHYPEVELQVLLLNEGRLADKIRGLGARVDIISEEGRSFLNLCRELRSWLGAHQFDIIHAHRYKEVALAVCASVPRSAKLVVTVHGLPPWSQMGVRAGFWIWSVAFLAYLYGAWFVAVSQEIERRLHRCLGKSRIVQVANPMPSVDAEVRGDGLRQELGWPQSRRLVGFIGRLERIKGPDLFLDIASLCSVDFGFVIIGSGSMKEDLETRARSEGIDARVRFLGEVSDATSYMRQLDVLALTSRHEGQPLVLLEAVACHVPIVAFDVGGVPELLSDVPSARLVRFGDLTHFARQIGEVLERDSGSDEAVRSGNSLRTRHGLSSTTRFYLDVYRAAQRSARS